MESWRKRGVPGTALPAAVEPGPGDGLEWSHTAHGTALPRDKSHPPRQCQGWGCVEAVPGSGEISSRGVQVTLCSLSTWPESKPQPSLQHGHRHGVLRVSHPRGG